MLWACVLSPLHTCCLLFFFPLLVCEDLGFIFFFSRGGVAEAATNAHLFSAFNSVFAVFSCFPSPPCDLFMPVNALSAALLLQLGNCRNACASEATRTPPPHSLPARRRRQECSAAQAGDALLHVLHWRCSCKSGAGGKVCESVRVCWKLKMVCGGGGVGGEEVDSTLSESPLRDHSRGVMQLPPQIVGTLHICACHAPCTLTTCVWGW